MSQDTWPPTDAADAYGWLRNWPRTRAAVEFAVFCELVEPCPAGPFRDLLRRCRSGAPLPPFVARALAANRSVVMVQMPTSHRSSDQDPINGIGVEAP